MFIHIFVHISISMGQNCYMKSIENFIEKDQISDLNLIHFLMKKITLYARKNILEYYNCLIFLNNIFPKNLIMVVILLKKKYLYKNIFQAILNCCN